MSEVETAWLAALVDGEGTISIGQRQRMDLKPIYQLSICNTHLPLMRRVVEVTGVDKIHVREHANPRHRTTHVWQVGGPDVLCLIRQMRPFLIVKADRADAALEWKYFPRGPMWDGIYSEKPDPVVTPPRADAVLAGESLLRQSRWDRVYPEVVTPE